MKTGSYKHDPLTESDLAQYSIPNRLRSALDGRARFFGLPPARLRVLDWGCGRGGLVLKLLEAGFDAYGADIDARALSNGRARFADRGHDHARRMVTVDPAGARTPFPPGHFHAVVSRQVFEHLGDLEAVAAELARLTVPGGVGLHKFPARWRVVEPHLFLPCLHWLPKNGLRYCYVRMMVGRMPRWPGTEAQAPVERAAGYYRYSIEKTFYRSRGLIRRILERQGFAVRFEGPARGTVAAHCLFRRFRATPMAGILRSWYSNTFQSVEMHLIRLPEPAVAFRPPDERTG